MLISTLSNRKIKTPLHDKGPIKRLILICDVDGVIRNSTEADVDPQIVKSIKDLIATQCVDVVFISGTPISQKPFLETWRRGNHTLDKAVGKFFSQELQENKITLYGALGGQRLTEEGHTDCIDQYPSEITFELGKLLLHAFLEQVLSEGDANQIKCAQDLRPKIDELKLRNKQQSSMVTANEFSDVVFKIHSKLDSNFKLLNHGSFVEIQTSNPPWNANRSAEWIMSQLHCPNLLISQYPAEQKQCAMGLGHRENEGFNFLMVSKINKSVAIKKYLQEKLRLHPNALIVTIGDTQVDFPMHQHAHLSFHVGKEQVWQEQALSHCMLIKDSFGQDSQHVNGTLYVLNYLKNNLGKSISEYIQ